MAKFALQKLWSVAMAATLALAGLNALAADPKVSAPAAAAKPMAAGDRMDINSASADMLATLPGIGEARAAAIIKGRPYSGKDDLVKKNILSEGVYDKIKDMVIARQK